MGVDDGFCGNFWEDGFWGSGGVRRVGVGK